MYIWLCHINKNNHENIAQSMDKNIFEILHKNWFIRASKVKLIAQSLQHFGRPCTGENAIQHDHFSCFHGIEIVWLLGDDVCANMLRTTQLFPLHIHLGDAGYVVFSYPVLPISLLKRLRHGKLCAPVLYFFFRLVYCCCCCSSSSFEFGVII